MYLKYGSYTHDPGECAVIISKEGQFTDNGQPYGVRERWDIEGRLQAATQGALTTAINSLMSAYSNHGRDICLYTDSGGQTSHLMRSSQTVGGTRVVRPPSFPQGRGVEYSTFRTYSIAVEGFFVTNVGNLIGYAEAINFQGTTGPIWGYLEPITGFPQQQLFQQSSVMRATQVGWAIGAGRYPQPNGPLWGPEFEHQELRQINYECPPDNSGRRRVSWAYVFDAIVPLNAYPMSSRISGGGAG